MDQAREWDVQAQQDVPTRGRLATRAQALGGLAWRAGARRSDAHAGRDRATRQGHVGMAWRLDEGERARQGDHTGSRAKTHEHSWAQLGDWVARAGGGRQSSEGARAQPGG